MNICYVDESGTPEVPGTSSHFVLAGISIPVSKWRETDRDVTAVLDRYGLGEAELHTAWLVRSCIEQAKIPNFDRLSVPDRRSAVDRVRAAHLLDLQRRQQIKSYRQTKKNYAHSIAYTHLTSSQRRALVAEIASCIANWSFARLFAECIDKLHFDPARTGRSISEQGLEQVVSRLEHYLKKSGAESYGILVHDNNDTVARKHTSMMRGFHKSGTLWTNITRISETPLFVNSELTRMVQIADFCSYALRRYVENGELEPFKTIFRCADKVNGTVVGVRHYTKQGCSCEICAVHRAPATRRVRGVGPMTELRAAAKK